MVATPSQAHPPTPTGSVAGVTGRVEVDGSVAAGVGAAAETVTEPTIPTTSCRTQMYLKVPGFVNVSL